MKVYIVTPPRSEGKTLILTERIVDAIRLLYQARLLSHSQVKGMMDWLKVDYILIPEDSELDHSSLEDK